MPPLLSHATAWYATERGANERMRITKKLETFRGGHERRERISFEPILHLKLLFYWGILSAKLYQRHSISDTLLATLNTLIISHFYFKMCLKKDLKDISIPFYPVYKQRKEGQVNNDAIQRLQIIVDRIKWGKKSNQRTLLLLYTWRYTYLHKNVINTTKTKHETKKLKTS